MTHVHVFIGGAWWFFSDFSGRPSSEPLHISKKFPATMMTGGLSDPKPATAEVQHLADQVSCTLPIDEFCLKGWILNLVWR